METSIIRLYDYYDRAPQKLLGMYKVQTPTFGDTGFYKTTISMQYFFSREKSKIFEKPRTYTGKYAQLVELTLSDEFYAHDKISLKAYKWDGTFIEVADWWALLTAIGYDYKKQRYV